jgi:DNA polymerase-3 subunit alpha
LLETASSIEGLARHASTHAAGVVISKAPLVDVAPLITLGEGDVNTQYDMVWVERIGLLKMDFLGLRNLTVMKKAVDEIRRSQNPEFDLAAIPDDDRATFAMLERGDTTGVFQLESDGMRRVAQELKPSVLDDIIALVALYRPGPMELIPQYLDNKLGRTTTKYLHPKLEPILAETYSVPIYQEQVMRIARDIAGFSMSEADELRKVMGKKLKDKIPVYRKKFVEGAVEQGLTAKVAEDIFAFVEPFAGYGFNKSHAAAYGWIAYQTAFLKANYPHAYLAALMTSVGDKTDKLVEYIEEARKIGIAVLPPDVNTSLESFTVVEREIRFGLAAIKGVGEGAVKAIIAAREAAGPFTDLFDLTGRVDSRQANRKVYEALIKSGALDSLGSNRAELLDAVDDALELSSRAARERELGQTSLFGGASQETAQALAPRMRRLPPPPMLEQLAWEKETLGIFVSGHPLAGVAEALKRTGAVEIRSLRELPEDENVTVAGLLIEVRRTLTKAQQQILYATIEDQTGSVEAIVFPKSYGQLQAAFQKDAIVVVKGRLRFRSGKASDESGDAPPSIHVAEVAPFQRPPERVAGLGWHVEVQERSQIDALAKLAHRWAGEVPVVVHVGERAQRMRGGIAESPLVKRELETIFARVWQEPV